MTGPSAALAVLAVGLAAMLIEAAIAVAIVRWPHR